MAGFVRWIVVLLAVVTVLNAESLEDNAANPVELAPTQKDAIEKLDDLAFQGENKGRKERRFLVTSFFPVCSNLRSLCFIFVKLLVYISVLIGQIGLNPVMYLLRCKPTNSKLKISVHFGNISQSASNFSPLNSSLNH